MKDSIGHSCFNKIKLGKENKKKSSVIEGSLEREPLELCGKDEENVCL